jgi:hypothetical protein
MVGTAARRSGWAQRLVAAIFLAIGAALMFGAYLLFRRAFRFILSDAVSGPLVLRYVLDTAFAFTYFLGVSSVIVTSNALLFGADDLKLLVPKPISSASLFAYRFVAATAASSWPVLLIAFPAIAALGATFGASPLFVVVGLAVMLLFVISVTIVGGLISFFLAWACRPLSLAFRKFLELLAFFGFGSLLVRKVVPHGIFELFNVNTPAQVAASAEKLHSMFAPLPSHPFAAAVSALVPSGDEGSLTVLLALTGVTLVVGFAVLMGVASVAYVRLWQRYGETGLTASVSDKPVQVGSRRPFPRLFRWGHSFLYEKDLLLFVRDGAAVSRAGFLLLLLGMYLLIVRAVTHAVDGSVTGTFFAYAVTFAFAAIGYFILTLTLRFVFPALSLEGRGAWLEWASPVHTHELFSWKVFFWSSLFMVAMEAAAVAVILLFGLPIGLGLSFAYATFLAVLSLVTFGMSAGSVAPDFRAKDPDEAATSPMGLAATGGGGFYLFIMARYMYGMATATAAGQPYDVLALVGMTIVSLTVIASSWAMALHFVDTLEVT